MIGRIRGELRRQYVGVIALFIALGGTSYAAVTLEAGSVGSREIRNRSVKNSDLANRSVGTRQLRSNAVTSSKIAAGAVNGDDVQNGSLSSADFQPGQLPAGAKGDTGPQGAKGDPGAKGEQGNTGASGSPDTPQQVLDKLATVDGAGSGLDADLFDGLASTAFMRGTGNVATGRVGRVGTSENDVVAFAEDDVTIRMDCVANTSVALELLNSSGDSYTVVMDDGSGTQSASLLTAGSAQGSRVETQSRSAGRGLLVHWLVQDQSARHVEVTATAYWDSGFCIADVLAVRAL